MESQLSDATQDRIMRALRRVERLAAFQKRLILAHEALVDLGGSHQTLARKFGELMAKTQEELQQEIADLRQRIVDDNTSDQAVVDGLDQTIKDLRAQVDAGNAIDTDALFASLEEAKSQITGVSSASGNTDGTSGGTGTSGTGEPPVVSG